MQNQIAIKKPIQNIKKDGSKVDIQIRVVESDNANGYHIRIYHDNRHHGSIEVRLTLDELKVYAQDLRDSIGILAEVPADVEPKRTLAHRGKSLRNKIFHTTDIRDRLRDVMDRTNDITKPHADYGVIQVTADNFHIPWDLLYDGPTPSDAEVLQQNEIEQWKNGFWGNRFIIWREWDGARDNHQRGPKPPDIQCSAPKVSLAANTTLLNVREQERPFFRRLRDEGRIDLEELQSLEAGQHTKGMKTLVSHYSKDFDIAHIACHASKNVPKHSHSTNVPRPHESFIEIDDAFSFTMDELNDQIAETEDEIQNQSSQAKKPFSYQPLVVLNGCHTASSDAHYESSNITRRFMKWGAIGVIATEWAVEDDLAAQFAEIFYGNLLSGMTLGNSFWETRRVLDTKRGGPVGLLYALYAPPQFVFTSLQ